MAYFKICTDNFQRMNIMTPKAGYKFKMKYGPEKLAEKITVYSIATAGDRDLRVRRSQFVEGRSSNTVKYFMTEKAARKYAQEKLSKWIEVKNWDEARKLEAKKILV